MFYLLSSVFYSPTKLAGLNGFSSFGPALSDGGRRDSKSRNALHVALIHVLVNLTHSLMLS